MELEYLMQDEMIPVDKLQLSHTIWTRRKTNQQKTTLLQTDVHVKISQLNSVWLKEKKDLSLQQLASQ